MSNYLPMTSTVFDLLCVQAEAGRSVDLTRGGLRATFAQAKAIATLMTGAGVLSLRNDGYDVCEATELFLLGCQLVNDKSSDRPETSPLDGQPTW